MSRNSASDYTAPPLEQQDYTAPPPDREQFIDYTAPPPDSPPLVPHEVEAEEEERRRESSSGSGGNKWISVFAYMFLVLSGLVVVVVEKRSRYNVFHGWQAMLLGAVYIVGAVFWGVVDFFVPLVFSLLSFLWFVTFCLPWLLCMLRAYQQAPFATYFQLPLLGSFAASRADAWIPREQ